MWGSERDAAMAARHASRSRSIGTAPSSSACSADVSPLAAARSARGRRNVAVWLKQAENRSRNAPNPNDPMVSYDFTWLWRELKL
jgi:hypothetical protein